MSSSNITELEEIPPRANNDQETTNYVINPTYCSYDADKPATVVYSKDTAVELDSSFHSIVDPTSNDKMYEIVPGDKSSPVPPTPAAPPPSTPPRRPPSLGVATPTPRHTTPNNMYVSRGQILRHPITTLDKNHDTPNMNNVEDDAKFKYSNKYLRVTCLSILIVASLFLAIVAVVLVLLLWFGVYVPNAALCSPASIAQDVIKGDCPENDLLSSTSTPLSTPIPTCLCPTPTDYSSIISEIEEKSSNITELIKSIDEELILFQNQSNATDQTLLSQSNVISSQVTDINSTCHETLVNLTSQNVSLSGLEFDAELRNVGLYSNCVYEYLSNCTMDLHTFNCSTSFHSVLVQGYFNLNLACHTSAKPPTGKVTGGVAFPLLASLHTRTRPGEQEDDTQGTQAILDKSEVRCDCRLIKNESLKRHNIITCFLFRLRCPVVNTLRNVLIKTP